MLLELAAAAESSCQQLSLKTVLQMLTLAMALMQLGMLPSGNVPTDAAPQGGITTAMQDEVLIKMATEDAAGQEDAAAGQNISLHHQEPDSNTEDLAAYLTGDTVRTY